MVDRTDHATADLIQEDHFEFVSTAGAPMCLTFTAWMTVICGCVHSGDRWMADVIQVDGGAKDPKTPTLFLVADVDDPTVRWVCADLITHIVPRVSSGDFLGL
jgi:hypothetical protein